MIECPEYTLTLPPPVQPTGTTSDLRQTRGGQAICALKKKYIQTKQWGL